VTKEIKLKSEEFITEENKGTYAGLKFSEDTVNRLINYAQNNDVPNILSEDEFHSTLLYSRKFLPEYKPKGMLDTSSLATPEKVEIWESPANAFKDKATRCLVLKYNCNEQVDRFNQLMDEHDATYDYDEYKPHTTLSYDVGDLQVEDFSAVEEIGKLEIVEEYVEELNLDKNYDSD